MRWSNGEGPVVLPSFVHDERGLLPEGSAARRARAACAELLARDGVGLAIAELLRSRAHALPGLEVVGARRRHGAEDLERSGRVARGERGPRGQREPVELALLAERAVELGERGRAAARIAAGR